MFPGSLVDGLLGAFAAAEQQAPADLAGGHTRPAGLRCGQ
jgi:hypothetical protein